MSRALRGSVAALGCALASACTLPTLPARLPAAPYVAVLSGQMPPPIDEVSRHAWIVVQHEHGRRRRYERGGGSSHLDPLDDFAAGDVMLHGVVQGTPAKIAELDACLSRADRAFYRKYPSYVPIPGPNSNTYVAELVRACGLGIELPATAIGRDYVGLAGAAITESGTGFIVGTFPLGLRVGLREGITVLFFGLPFGVHFVPPGIEVPVNPGRLGFATDGHTYRAPRREFRRPYDDAFAEDGAATAQLYAAGFASPRPRLVSGLEGGGLVGLSLRAVYGKHVGYAGGLDLEMGASVPAGLLGRAHLYPVGLGVMLGPTGYLAVFGGVGVSGASEHLVGALELPVEARLELDLGPRGRVGFFAREAFAPFEPARSLGVTGLGELSFGLRARLGSAWGYERGVWGSGMFFGFERREVARGSLLGLFVGTEIDVGFSAERRRRQRRRHPVSVEQHDVADRGQAEE